MIKVKGLKYIGTEIKIVSKSGRESMDREKDFKGISEINIEIMELRYTLSRWEGEDFLPEEEIVFRKHIDKKHPVYRFHPEEPESLPYNPAWILASCTPHTYRKWLREYYENMIEDLCNDISLLNDTLKKEREKTRMEWELKGFEDQETI